MNVSQKLNHIYEKNYEDEITVTFIPPFRIIHVTNMTYDKKTSTRKIRIEVTGGIVDKSTQRINSSFVRQEGENAVKVTVFEIDTILATSTHRYS